MGEFESGRVGVGVRRSTFDVGKDDQRTDLPEAWNAGTWGSGRKEIIGV